MRTFARVLVTILGLVVGGGAALDGCLVSCHDPFGDERTGSAHCHEATAENSALRIVAVSSCSHDHGELSAAAGELQQSSKASAADSRPEAAVVPALSISVLASRVDLPLSADRAVAPIPLRI